MKKILFLGCAAGLLAVSGCIHTTTGTSVNTVENAQKYAEQQMITDRRIVTDQSLGKAVTPVGINVVNTPGDLLKVQVEIQNQTRSLQRFTYHFQWLDAHGMQLENALSATIADQIEGKESKFISSIAPSPDCKDFRVVFIKNK